MRRLRLWPTCRSSAETSRPFGSRHRFETGDVRNARSKPPRPAIMCGCRVAPNGRSSNLLPAPRFPPPAHRRFLVWGIATVDSRWKTLPRQIGTSRVSASPFAQGTGGRALSTPCPRRRSPREQRRGGQGVDNATRHRFETGDVSCGSASASRDKRRRIDDQRLADSAPAPRLPNCQPPP